MNPNQLFHALGGQLGQIMRSSKEMEKSGYRVEQFILETGFEINPDLRKIKAPKRQSYLDGGTEPSVLRVKVTVY